MNSVIRRVLGESKREPETRTYTIKARPDHLDQIEKFFSWINSTRSGHSGTAKMFVDGDGAARVEIERKDGELSKPDEEVKSRGDGEPEYSACLESNDTPTQVIVDTRPVEFHRCPHCRNEIYEKHSYVDASGTERHSDCGGAIKWPPPSAEELAYFKKNWGDFTS